MKIKRGSPTEEVAVSENAKRMKPSDPDLCEFMLGRFQSGSLQINDTGEHTLTDTSGHIILFTSTGNVTKKVFDRKCALLADNSSSMTSVNTAVRVLDPTTYPAEWERALAACKNAGISMEDLQQTPRWECQQKLLKMLISKNLIDPDQMYEFAKVAKKLEGVETLRGDGCGTTDLCKSLPTMTQNPMTENQVVIITTDDKLPAVKYEHYFNEDVQRPFFVIGFTSYDPMEQKNESFQGKVNSGYVVRRGGRMVTDARVAPGCSTIAISQGPIFRVCDILGVTSGMSYSDVCDTIETKLDEYGDGVTFTQYHNSSDKCIVIRDCVGTTAILPPKRTVYCPALAEGQVSFIMTSSKGP